MAVRQFLFFAVAVIVAGQSPVEDTRENECRHTCIMSRENPTSVRSTPCAIRDKTVLRDTFSLATALDPKSQWALHHSGSINGQLVYFDNNPRNRAVWFLSQKSCLDFGDHRGFPATAMYQNVSAAAGSANLSLIADWDFVNPSGDIFKGCTEHKIPWTDALLKKSASEKGSRVPPAARRSMRIHREADIHLEPYDFKYTAKDIGAVFQRALNETETKSSTIPEGILVSNMDFEFLRKRSDALTVAAVENRSIPRTMFALEPNMPLLLRGHPFESGLSIITTAKINSTIPRDFFVQDMDTLGWNRLQEVVGSLDNGPESNVHLPDAIKTSELLNNTVLAVTALAAFVLALVSIEKAGRERVLRFRRPKQEHQWTFVYSAFGCSQLRPYRTPVSRHEFFGAVVAFIGAVFAIVAAVLTFREAGIRYTKFLYIRQGFVVTYGPSNPARWAVGTPTGQANPNAGARFIVGVWLKAQFETVGYRGVFEVITAAYTCFGVVLLLSWYRFSMLRQNRLVPIWHRKPMQLVRGVIQAVTGGLVRLPLVHMVLGSYLSEYRSIAQDLAKDFDVENFVERVG